IVGGEGNDMLYGEPGDDLLYGGEGNDTYIVYADNVGSDVIEDEDGIDTLDLSSYSFDDVIITAEDSDEDDNIDDLRLEIDEDNVIIIRNFFNNDAENIVEATAGSGAIENILFANDVTMSFNDIKAHLSPQSLV